MVCRKHRVFPTNHVNPIYFTSIEQIHRVEWITKAIPSDPDLL